MNQSIQTINNSFSMHVWKPDNIASVLIWHLCLVCWKKMYRAMGLFLRKKKKTFINHFHESVRYIYRSSLHVFLYIEIFMLFTTIIIILCTTLIIYDNYALYNCYLWSSALYNCYLWSSCSDFLFFYFINHYLKPVHHALFFFFIKWYKYT